MIDIAGTKCDWTDQPCLIKETGYAIAIMENHFLNEVRCINYSKNHHADLALMQYTNTPTELMGTTTTHGLLLEKILGVDH